MTAEVLSHAVTVPQPLAWACAAGHCPVIMSDTRPPLAREGELVGIHASRTSGEAKGECWRSVDRPASRELVFGALIGVARLVGVVREIQCAIGPAGELIAEALYPDHGRSPTSVRP